MASVCKASASKTGMILILVKVFTFTPFLQSFSPLLSLLYIPRPLIRLLSEEKQERTECLQESGEAHKVKWLSSKGS